MRFYGRRRGGQTRGMGAPELRQKIQQIARRTLGVRVTMAHLRQYTNTDYLYAAMRSVQGGFRNHPIITAWLEQHPLDDEAEEEGMLQLALF